MLKLAKKLSTKHFIISHLFILLLGLTFLAALYYILHIQYQKPTKLYSASGGPVTTPPKSLRIDLQQPDDDALTFQSTIIVSGKTAPNSEVLIFTESQDLVLRSTSNGTFSTIVKLDEEVNRILAVVFDVTGDARSAERTVYYSKEKL